MAFEAPPIMGQQVLKENGSGPIPIPTACIDVYIETP